MKSVLKGTGCNLALWMGVDQEMLILKASAKSRGLAPKDDS